MNNCQGYLPSLIHFHEKNNDFFCAFLAERLYESYLPPAVPAGHDIEHVSRMLMLWPKIQAVMNFKDETAKLYYIAVWLHNIDRSEKEKTIFFEKKQRDAPASENGLAPVIIKKDLVEMCSEILSHDLAKKELTAAAIAEIITAVRQHNKFLDEPNDSETLQALRIADKIDRFSASGLWAISSLRGSQLLMFPTNKGYGSTEEHKLTSIYEDLFRVLEWPAMLPLKARSILNDYQNGVAVLVNQAIAVANECIELYASLGRIIPSFVENDLRKAFSEISEIKKLVSDNGLITEDIFNWENLYNKLVVNNPFVLAKDMNYVNYLIRKYTDDKFALAKAIMDYGLLDFVHEDNRRAIYEYNNKENDFGITLIEVKQDSVLGNHYHSQKDEHFFCLLGSGTFRLSVNNRNVPDNLNVPLSTGMSIGMNSLKILPGTKLVIPSGVYHTALLSAGTKLLVYNTAIYNPQDMLQ